MKRIKSPNKLFVVGIAASLLYASAFSLFGTAEKAHAATVGIISGETYTITAKHSGLAIGVSGANNTQEGTSVMQGSDASMDEAKWEITNLDGNYYKIINKNSGKALSVKNAFTGNNASVVQNTYVPGGVANDEWLLTDAESGYYQLINRNSGKALNISGESQMAGTTLTQLSKANIDTQKFLIKQVSPPAYKFVVICGRRIRTCWAVQHGFDFGFHQCDQVCVNNPSPPYKPND